MMTLKHFLLILGILSLVGIVAATDPWAGYVPTSVTGDAPLTVYFHDISYNSPTAWNWSFQNVTGDNKVVWFNQTQNPVYTFTAAGNYSIRLNSSNVYGYNITPELVFVNVSGAPIATFSSNVTQGASPLGVKFIDTSSGTPTSWSWAYWQANGSWTQFSTSQSPERAFTTGTSNTLYSINLTVTNAAGTNSTIKTAYINVSPAGYPPVAAFSGTPTSGNAPLNVTFTDASTNTPTGWAWYYNAGGSDVLFNTSQNPIVSLPAGNYSIKLKASNYNGYSWANKTAYVSVTATVPPPVANFVADYTSGIAPLTVHFTDLSTNTPTSWMWYFDFVNSSTAQDPDFTYYTPGLYTVILTASNAGGMDDETKLNYINVTAPGTTLTPTPTPTPTPTGTTPIPTATPTPIVTGFTGPQIVNITGVTSNNADLAIESVTGSDVWVEWGQNSGGYTWQTDNVTADNGSATAKIWGAPLLGNTHYYATACDETGCGNEVQFDTSIITPLPTSTFGQGYKNLTQSHFNVMFAAPAILQGYFNVVPATVFWSVVLISLTVGLWRRNRSVRLVSIVMIILSPLIMSSNAGIYLGVVGGVSAVGSALLAAGISGILLSFIKK